MTTAKVDQFTAAYVACALWASTDDDGDTLEDYSVSDIDSGTLESMMADCADFQAANAELLATWYEKCGESDAYSICIERAGHDFWLTRNRHGAGFWDRWSAATPQGKVGRKLSDAAHAYGEYHLYVGDDGMIYGS